MEDNIKEKLKAFEYLIFKLKDWYNEIEGFNFDNNDFSKLKVLKLIFFSAAVNADKPILSLLDNFDNFYAMPYGHVESDIYKNLNSLNLIDVDSKKTLIKNLPDYFKDLNAEIKAKIDNSIFALKAKNINLITYSAMELVELSHMHFSWSSSFDIAKQQNKLSQSIPKEMIKSEKKFFYL